MEWHRVRLPARAIRWPVTCCCCMRSADSSITITGGESGKWQVPCCSRCIAHQQAFTLAEEAAKRLAAFRPNDIPRVASIWLILGSVGSFLTIFVIAGTISRLSSLSVPPEGMLLFIVTSILAFGACVACFWMYRSSSRSEIVAVENRRGDLEREADEAEEAIKVGPNCCSAEPAARYVGQEEGGQREFEFGNPKFVRAVREVNAGKAAD